MQGYLRRSDDDTKTNWFLWLLLLIPGFWLFSVRLMLDIPATAMIAIVMLLVLKKAKPIWIGLAMLGVILVKEYYIYLLAPVVLIALMMDQVESNKPWYRRVLTVLGQLTVIAMPGLLVSIALIDLNIFPYPRIHGEYGPCSTRRPVCDW